MNTILKRRQPKNHAAGVSTVRNPLEKTTGVPRFAMGLRVHVDPEIDRTKEEQDENRHQSTERQHPELPCFEFAAAGSELPSGPRPPSRARREIAFPPDPTAGLGGPPLDAKPVGLQSTQTTPRWRLTADQMANQLGGERHQAAHGEFAAGAVAHVQQGSPRSQCNRTLEGFSAAWGPISSAAPPGLTRQNRRAIERRPRCAR
jgi:hypothetical protein